MSIISKVEEYCNLEKEIKLYKSKLSFLKKRKDDIKDDITEYLDETGSKGFKYKGIAFLKEKKTKRKPKKKIEKTNDCIEVLKKHGIQNPTIILNELIEARKGSLSEQEILKIKKT